MRTARRLSLAALAAALTTVAACSGAGGPAGPAGAPGPTGPTGPGAWITGPGLLLALSAPVVAADGTMAVTVTLTDDAGVPLDRSGLRAAGAVDLAFVAAWLGEAGGVPGSYTAYGAGAESGGAFADLAPGQVRYTFVARAAPANAGRTHTLAVSAARTFDGVRATAAASLDLRPDGAAVTTRRALVTDAACDACHGGLTAHAGAWRSSAQCVLCHGPGLQDGAGASLDLKVMVHKIHRGRDLPSVAAGQPYRLVDAGGTARDFSTVGFPQAIGRCTTCHQGADAARYEATPSRAACASCHDLTAFLAVPPIGQVVHTGGPQQDDTNCTVCHRPGGLSPVAARHQPLVDALPAVEATILAVTSTAPGQVPQVDLAVTVGGVPRDLLGAPLTRLGAIFAGPTADYATTWSAVIQGTGATGTLVALGPPGQFRWTAPAGAAIPLPATGSYALALEAWLQPLPADPRVAAANVPFFFAVTDPAPEARRAILAPGACQACHHRLEAHGGGRTSVEYCAFCHNPQAAGQTQAPRFEGATVAAPSIDLKVMIHAIHRGAGRVSPYVLGGFPPPTVANPAGTPIDFSVVRFPGDLARCTTCHLARAIRLPLLASVHASTERTLACTEPAGNDANAYCDAPFFNVVETRLVPPTTAACGACHDSASTAVHAQVMTNAAGQESCTTCHGPGAVFDQAAFHRP